MYSIINVSLSETFIFVTRVEGLPKSLIVRLQWAGQLKYFVAVKIRTSLIVVIVC